MLVVIVVVASIVPLSPLLLVVVSCCLCASTLVYNSISYGYHVLHISNRTNVRSKSTVVCQTSTSYYPRAFD
ncbi:hypothetical protein C8Q74DRAFT_101709 [Fomes fomentarius]|nr:hypothetical protein C8Q74DRAFT_101709 [Fomes fomentarius]